MDTKIYVWHVEGSLPPEEGRSWRKNMNITVLAPTMDRVFGLVVTNYPELELHKIMRDRDAHQILMSGEVRHAAAMD